MSTVPDKRRFTVQEYLAREEVALARSEYYRGEIFATAGASVRHNVIAGNVFAHLHSLLRGRDCRPYGSDQRIKIESLDLFTYADTVVICGEVQRARDDLESATNPRVIIEVLSPSTEAYDRGRKFRFFQQLDSFREYVLIDQDQPWIEWFSRREGGTWVMQPLDGLDAWLDLASIGCRLALRSIYDGVTFAEEPAG